MPRYFFHTQVGPNVIRDPEGEVLTDADAAWHAARLLILQLLNGGERELSAASLTVTNAAGETLFEFPFMEVIAREPASRRP